MSRATLDTLAEIMTDDAELRLATDDADYLSWILEHITAHPAFEWLARRPGDWRERPPDWPPTRYEAKARAAGRSARLSSNETPATRRNLKLSRPSPMAVSAANLQRGLFRWLKCTAAKPGTRSGFGIHR